MPSFRRSMAIPKEKEDDEKTVTLRPTLSKMDSRLMNSKLRIFNRNVVSISPKNQSKNIKEKAINNRSKRKNKQGVHMSSLQGITGVSSRDLLSSESEDSFDAEKNRERQWSPSARRNHHKFSPKYANNNTNSQLLQQQQHSLRISSRIRTSPAPSTSTPNPHQSIRQSMTEAEERELDETVYQTLVRERRSSLPAHTGHFASNHVLVNRDRVKRGILPLHRDRGLDEIAQDHAKQMATRGKTFHAEADGLMAKVTALSPCRRLGENVGSGTSIEAIHKKMMLSPQNSADKNNMLDRRFSSFGVGAAMSEKGKRYICQVFKG